MNNIEYHPVAKLFHWTIVLFVVAQFMNSEFVPRSYSTASTNFLSNAHFSFGVAIFFIALGLLLMRFLRPVEKLEVGVTDVWGKATTAVRYALYALLFVVPLLGWALVSSNSVAVSFFGLFELPLFVIAPDYADLIKEAHEGLAGLMGFLAAGHTAAALYHHFVLKDIVLQRMLPKFLLK